MTIELENYEAEECIEALEQSVLSLNEVLKNIHPAQELAINAMQKVITTQRVLVERLQSRIWEAN
tara:strand:+ start:113 stop:307 length:195 start_codon:yes stop_codon:yes gene_type:complete